VLFRSIQLAYNKIVRYGAHFILRYKMNAFDCNLKMDYPIAIIYPEYVQVGKNCTINRNVFIHAGGGVCLGNNVTISAGAKIITCSYETQKWREQESNREHYAKKVIISDGTWICAGATILPGVQISGKGVIVAANSVVNADITEDYVLVAGAPAVIKKRLIDEGK